MVGGGLMADLEITRDGELMVAQIQGASEEGVEFVDAYFATDDIIVVDSGRIIVPLNGLENVYRAAREDGLNWELV
jgi:hypothetical protein